MPAKSTLLLPRLKGFRLHRFVPMFTEDLSMVVEERSPNIILGGNGLGKTTIMQAIVYGLTGIKTLQDFRYAVNQDASGEANRQLTLEGSVDRLTRVRPAGPRPCRRNPDSPPP